MRKQIVVLEDSSKVGFGGGQNISLQVADILSKDYNVLFVDFTGNSRYFKLIDEKFPQNNKVVFKSNFVNKFRIKLLQLIDEGLGFIIFKNYNIKKLMLDVNPKECIIYATTRRSLIYAEKINRKFNIPYIYHAHLVEKKDSLGYMFIKNALSKAETVICVSRAVQNSINLNNTVLLYNPIPRFQTLNKDKVNNRFVIASIGSLIPIKGFEYFIKAAALFDENFNVEFRIYGEGLLRFELEKMGNGRVVMKGFCPNIIQELKDEIDIVVLSSVIEEALPTVIIEAKSVGIPVIATNIGGQAEIIRDTIDGFLVPIRNEKAIYESLCRLICDVDLYNRISKESFNSSKKFSTYKFKKNILFQIGSLFK